MALRVAASEQICFAIGMGDGEGESGRGDTVHALGAVELPIIKLGLVRASRGKDCCCVTIMRC
jgi:hypothetical protein